MRNELSSIIDDDIFNINREDDERGCISRKQEISQNSILQMILLLSLLIEEEEAPRRGVLIPWSWLRIYCRYHVPRTQEEKERLKLILEWMRSRGFGSKENTYDYWFRRDDEEDDHHESNRSAESSL